MIYLGNRPPAPAVLTTRGATAATNHCAEYDSAPDEYRSGTKFFKSEDFDGNVYAHADVKDALIAYQHAKCAFCESFVPHVSYGTVEHFRPKAGYRLRRGEPLRRPGYYWLAYDWDNLFFACQLCNEQFKENLFPLKDNRSRARAHTHQLTKEVPLLINPATQDPSHYIGFRRHVPFAVNGCREGTETIEVVGLKRDKLTEYRRQRLQDLEAVIEACKLLEEVVKSDPSRQPDLQLWKARLQAKTQNDAPYAAMARAFLAALP